MNTLKVNKINNETMRLTVYGDLHSGNCYKVKLLLLLLEQQHEWVHVDILQGETHTDTFKHLNPNAKIPTVELTDGRVLWESNAILNYLAAETDYSFTDHYQRTQILQWQFFEQYSHEPYIAVARYLKLYLGLPENRLAEFQAKQAGGQKALAVMDKHLRDNKYLVGDKYSIADISLYAYTHVAEEGGFSLEAYPHVNQWIKRLEAQPNHQTMHACIQSAC